MLKNRNIYQNFDYHPYNLHLYTTKKYKHNKIISII